MRSPPKSNSCGKFVDFDTRSAKDSEGDDDYVRLGDIIVLQSKISDATGDHESVYLCATPKEFLRNKLTILRKPIHPLLSSAPISVMAAAPGNDHLRSISNWDLIAFGTQPNDLSTLEVADLLAYDWKRGIRNDGELTDRAPFEPCKSDNKPEMKTSSSDERAFLSKHLRINTGIYTECIENMDENSTDLHISAILNPVFRAHLIPRFSEYGDHQRLQKTVISIMYAPYYKVS